MNAAHHLDANVILRFLLADDPNQSPKARALFARAEEGKLTLFVSHVALAEVAWVLLSFYDLERGKLAQTLRELLLHDGIEADDAHVLLDALDHFRRANADFIDCYAAAQAKARGAVVVTYDRDFRKFADVTALRPEEVVRQFP